MTCPRGRAGKLQNPDSHQGLPTLDPVFFPWQKIWPFTRREHCPWPCPLSWASEKLCHGISSVDFDLLGKVSVWTFVKTEEWDKMNSQVTCMAVKSVILFQDFMKLKWFPWNAWCRKYHSSCKAVYLGPSNQALWLKNIGEGKGTSGKWSCLFHTRYHLILMFYFKTFVHSTLSHEIPSPLHHASFPHMHRDFHFDPNCFSFDSVANRPSECVS